MRVRTHFYQKPSEYEEGVGSFVNTMYVLEDDTWVATNHWLASREYRPPTAHELALFNQKDLFEATKDKTSLFEIGRNAQVAAAVDDPEGPIHVTGFTFAQRAENNHQEDNHQPVGIVRIRKHQFVELWESAQKPELPGADVRVSERYVYITPMVFANFRDQCAPALVKRIVRERSDYPAPDDYQHRSLPFDPYWLTDQSFEPGAFIYFDGKPAYWMGTFTGEHVAYRLKRADSLSGDTVLVEAARIKEQNPGAKPSETTIIKVDGRSYLWENTLSAGVNSARVVDDNGRVHIDLIDKLVHRMSPPPAPVTSQRGEASHCTAQPVQASVPAQRTMLGLLSRMNRVSDVAKSIEQATPIPTQATLNF